MACKLISASIAAAAVAAMLAVSGPAFAASAVDGMTSTLSATPAAFRGRCPAVITFNGTITVTGKIDPDDPVQIGYQFLRSDNATGPISYYTITEPGTQAVSDTWTLGGAPLPNYSGWEQLKAWPTGHEGGFGYSFSGNANFSVRCTRR